LILSGTIVKGIAGFYYVEAGGVVYECKARGVFKNEKMKPYVGDEVDIDISDDTPVVVRIHERKNEFLRPPVANVEQFVIVSAMTYPEPNLPVIDKFLVMAELKDVDAVLCFTKVDLVSEKKISEMRAVYSSIYPVAFIDAKDESSVQDLVPYLFEKKSALAGPSGVGKSTILSALRRDTSIQTGAISEKTKRGRHTTRHVELFSLDFGGKVFDTPGFTSFDVPDIGEDELQFLFPDIERYTGQCKFGSGCRHTGEPGCAVCEAVEKGEIHKLRYDSYLSQLAEIREREKRKYQ
jgi:ribosome biogenesis GTPase / thiamine phosphate phosphatase